MSATPGPPAPKCPAHKIFMQYKHGKFPGRWYYCPECHDHWKECGFLLNQVTLKKAYS